MRLAPRAVAAMLTAALLLTVPATAQAGITIDERAAWASGYISSQQKINGSIPAFSTLGSTADAVVALVAARRGPTNISKALKYLSRQVEKGAIDSAPARDQVGLLAKVTLAAVAGGKNPDSFGGKDLPQAILNTEQSDGRYGTATGSFNQAEAMLALFGAGVTPSAKARAWLVGAQCPDGGWSYDGPPKPNDDSHCTDIADPGDDYYSSDTNTTSLAVQALELPSAGPPTLVVHDPFAYFTTMRDDQFGGWGFTWGFDTSDANSTGLVIQAYAAAGVSLPAGVMGALKALQYKYCGGFAYSWDTWSGPTPVRMNPDVGATMSAVLGLLRKPLPVAPATVTKAAPAPIGCPA